ncbi:hypothetical protein A3770_01p03080 [Chloropicon primus]|uniref:Uncharacterized protein n=1 Tax=Chloropicon primus TaxID=1764295 RepID=A0A5B8MEN3_9CHLO|nr:hypothetical protein A3770_01p03080 [Chloropicon primus]|eukprot:QDZ17790.1 hypothetical protein A3770_01p03080 [Chloropicon primus]
MIIPGRKALLSCLAWVAAFALVLPGVAGRDRGLQLNSHVLLYGQLNPPAGSSDPGASIHVHATVLERGGRSYESSATWSNDFPSSYSLHIPVGSTEGGGQDRTPMLSPAHEVRATATFVLNSSDCALFMEKQSHATANGFHARIDFEWNGHAASVVSR